MTNLISRSTFFVLVLIATVSRADEPARSADLATRIRTVTDGPDYKHGRWGILIQDAKTGAVLYEQNADTLFVPASTTKLYSCSAALHYLGPNYRFETTVVRRGEVEKGVLNGDLILIASGDLTLGGRTLPDGTMAFVDNDHTYADPTSTTANVTPTDPLAGLRSLAKQVRTTGIREIKGEVLIDDRLFDTSRSSGSGPSRVTPILVNDNVIDVLVSPGLAAGQPAAVKLWPETTAVLVDSQVRTTAEGPLRVEATSAGPGRILVRGSIPVKAKPVVRICTVDDPASFARSLLIESLRHEGVEVKASPLQEPAVDLPPRSGCRDLAVVATYQSPPLSEAIKVTLKVSHNLYASTLPLLIAAKHGERTATAGLKRQGEFLKQLGVDTNAVSFAGGAGGMNADSTSPRATVQLLTRLAERPEYPTLEAGLPVLGVDGTLAGMVSADSPARGKVHAKTGTLWWTDVMNDRPLLRSKALAGVMTTTRNRKLVFAMFVNDVPLPQGVTPTREGKVLGKICEIVHQYGD